MPLFVNSERVEDKEIYKEFDFILKTLSKKNADFDENLIQGARVLAKKNVLKRTLIRQEVENNPDIDISYKEIESHFKKIKKHFGGNEKFEKTFKENKKNDLEIKKNIELSLKVDGLIEKWSKEEIESSKEEIELFYKNNQNTFYKNNSYEEIKSVVEKDLIQRKKNILIKKKIAELKNKAKIIDQVILK